MKVIAIKNLHRNDCDMDTQCEHCGHIEVDKHAYNDSNYIDNVVPERYCPKCKKNVKGEIEKERKFEKKLQDSLDSLSKHLSSLTEEEKEELGKQFEDKTPKGWNSIEDHLPKMLAMDIMHGCTKYKVRRADGIEGISYVADHNTWYYRAKEEGITHWFNE